MSDVARSVHAWSTAVDAVTGLLADLPDTDWARATDCPGWSVHDVVAHLAHLESVLAAGGDGPAAGASVVTSAYTEAGVEARRGRAPGHLLGELVEATAVRRGQLDPVPTDPAAAPDATLAGLGWDVGTLLRNRALDLWVHEQDLRRALGHPGGLDAPGAVLTTRVFADAVGFVLARRAGARPGVVLELEVEGPVPVRDRWWAGADGRARRDQDGGVPADVVVRTDTETFVLLGAGRRDPASLPVELRGDVDLGRRFCAALAVVP